MKRKSSSRSSSKKIKKAIEGTPFIAERVKSNIFSGLIFAKREFLRILNRLFAATLVGNVYWVPNDMENVEAGECRSFSCQGLGSIHCRIERNGMMSGPVMDVHDYYYVVMSVETSAGLRSIDGTSSSKGKMVFTNLWWAVSTCWELWRLLGVKALPEDTGGYKQFEK